MPQGKENVPLVLTEKQISAFWARVDIRGENECWNWKCATAGAGYGALHIRQNGVDNKYYAHRIAWQITNGRVPRDGYEIAHAPIICHNRLCCNPTHLIEKTKIENELDKKLDNTIPSGEKHWTKIKPQLVRRGDNHYTKLRPESILRGENRYWQVKFTWEEIKKIRELHKEGISAKELARMFNTCDGYIRDIVFLRRRLDC